MPDEIESVPLVEPETDRKVDYVLCFILGIIATLLCQRLSAPSEYILGPRGGCYYIARDGDKTYVDHRYCQKKAE